MSPFVCPPLCPPICEFRWIEASRGFSLASLHAKRRANWPAGAQPVVERRALAQRRVKWQVIGQTGRQPGNTSAFLTRGKPGERKKEKKKQGLLSDFGDWKKLSVHLQLHSSVNICGSCELSQASCESAHNLQSWGYKLLLSVQCFGLWRVASIRQGTKLC